MAAASSVPGQIWLGHFLLGLNRIGGLLHCPGSSVNVKLFILQENEIFFPATLQAKNPKKQPNKLPANLLVRRPNLSRCRFFHLVFYYFPDNINQERRKPKKNSHFVFHQLQNQQLLCKILPVFAMQRKARLFRMIVHLSSLPVFAPHVRPFWRVRLQHTLPICNLSTLR